MMLGSLTRAIYNHNARMIDVGQLPESLRQQLWKKAREEALKIREREGDLWWRVRLADRVDRRISEDQPHGRRRRKHWKHGAGRKAIWPSQWKGRK